jgi:hypothetical protein
VNRVTRCVYEKLPKFLPTPWLSKLIHKVFHGKNSPKIRAASLLPQKLPKVNKCPIGENAPNLITLNMNKAECMYNADYFLASVPTLHPSYEPFTGMENAFSWKGSMYNFKGERRPPGNGAISIENTRIFFISDSMEPVFFSWRLEFDKKLEMALCAEHHNHLQTVGSHSGAFLAVGFSLGYEISN